MRRNKARSWPGFFCTGTRIFLDEPFTTADGAANILEAETAVASTVLRFAVDISPLDNLSCALANLAGRTTGAATAMTSAFDRFFFLLISLVLPHVTSPTLNQRLRYPLGDMTAHGR
ncbi:hypothetical protein [Ruegeria sp. HKCCD7255]|uniref:hypothetical protein n=1 Tax=Ruegeria sp. HKCCD7255 TaxID=2683004 RepID=UPI00148787AC|nr:hypothetical protein [Ruegeria sp. HKCCD7255]